MPAALPYRPNARRALAALTGVAAVALTATAGAAAAEAADPGYTVTSLHFAVTVGPNHDQHCDIVGDLYVPNGASAAHRVPSILTTNGFGGSAADQTPFAEQEATRGYAVLSYSGLGFGGSGCKITLDDPDWDGQAASQLVSYLGGAPGIAFTDAQHTTPAPVLTSVVHDARDHRGVAHAYDPRVGMWGGSYGGQIQFAAADVDARVDAINPQITWNDLSYSLGPNNATNPGSVTVADPGAVKLTWGALFSSVGILDGVQYSSADPYRLVGCPNFADFVCTALVTGGTTGYFQASDVAKLRHASVASYLANIRIPVLLDQGEVDTLFNLNEAVATYTALRRQGTPVWMLWRDQGHSGGTPSAAGKAYEDARIQTFFDHYLKGSTAPVGSAFAYYRDWAGTFAESGSYPLGSGHPLYLSGGGATAGGALVAARPATGTQSFTTTAAGAPTTLSDLDAIGGQVPAGTLPSVPDTNAPGTFASWTTAPLGGATDVVGPPQLTVSISAPTATATSAAGPGGQVVLFAKVYDVAPGGTASLINGLVAPVRVADPGKPVHITLPAFAHRFAAGHEIRLVLAGGDPNYRGGITPTPISVTSGRTQVLSLPVTG